MSNHTQPHDISALTEDQQNEELNKGFSDISEGRTKPAEKVFAEVRKKYVISD